MADTAEIVKVSRAINTRIGRLEKVVAGPNPKKEDDIGLDEAGEDKAQAIADYDRAYAVAMAKIGLGVVNQIDGQQLPESRPATVLGKYAAGYCHKEKCAMIQAESKYKSILTKISVLEATLNAKQSINRHLSHEAR